MRLYLSSSAFVFSFFKTPHLVASWSVVPIAIFSAYFIFILLTAAKKLTGKISQLLKLISVFVAVILIYITAQLGLLFSLPLVQAEFISVMIIPNLMVFQVVKSIEEFGGKI